MSKSVNYKKIKEQWIKDDLAPSWVSTNSVQFFSQKYAYKGETWRDRVEQVCKYLASNAPSVYPDWWENDEYTKGLTYEEVFFKLRWDGHIVDSTPLFANAGVSERGMTISCSGQTLFNSLAEKSYCRGELEQLVKNSHGCAWNFADWLAEGDVYDADGNRSDGIIPIIKDIHNLVKETNQGVRRGQVVFGVDIEHGDFWQVAQLLVDHHDEMNIAWHIRDSFTKSCVDNEEEALKRFGRVMQIRMQTGKGYFTKLDTMNRNKADVFKILGLDVTGSNLCNELNLPSNREYTFSCPIINANLVNYRSFPKHLFHLQLIMQDCNVTGYLKQIDEKKGRTREYFSKIYNFTKDFRAVGCGTAGFHSLLMQERIPTIGFDALALNDEIFSRMRKDTYEASEWLGKVLGVPDKMKEAGLTRRNATTMFSPPTKSSADLAKNSPSEGIGLQTAMVKMKEVTGTDIFRIEPAFLSLLKEKNKYTQDVIKSVVDNYGSVQHLDFLTEHEKLVFLTAFETPMAVHLGLCSGRQPYFDQQQSINLYLSGSDSPEYIAEIHKNALLDDWCNGLYYCYSIRGGVFQRLSDNECEVCQ